MGAPDGISQLDAGKGERCERRQWRKKRAERVAAVEKIEEKRKPDDFFGHRNRGKKMSKKAVDESPDVKCPYYKHESKWEICCEGVQADQSFHVAFSLPVSRKAYEKQFCKSCWGQCLIARGLNRRWAA